MGDGLIPAFGEGARSVAAGSGSLAIVTPSYAPDFELCRTLNRSVMEFLPNSVKHYIFVDRRDFKLFRTLSGSRTSVVIKEEMMPRGIYQVPGTNRWVSNATFLPITGWLVQQIAKIAAADFLTEDALVMVDSDAVFVRDVDTRIFIDDGRTRLYRQLGAIREHMTAHISWHHNASRLLDLPRELVPLTDYIGQVIGWDRAIVRDMCARIETVNGCSWHAALARARQVSEYLLYGMFVEQTPEMRNRVWIDERSRVGMYWEIAALSDTEIDAFARSLDDEDIALMITSHSKTSPEARRLAIATATNGRL